MLSKLIYIGLLNFLAVMSPGPDFAIVTQNTLLYSRRAGIYTSLGIGVAIFIHITYCALGLAIIITRSTFLFSCIAFCGGSYLIYLGIESLKAIPKQNKTAPKTITKRKDITNLQAFKKGFFTNILNPKAILFFLAIFSFFMKEKINFFFNTLLAIELFIIVAGWFCFVSYMLSHKKIEEKFSLIKPTIIKLTGIGLIAMGTLLLGEEILHMI